MTAFLLLYVVLLVLLILLVLAVLFFVQRLFARRERGLLCPFGRGTSFGLGLGLLLPGASGAEDVLLLPDTGDSRRSLVLEFTGGFVDALERGRACNEGLEEFGTSCLLTLCFGALGLAADSVSFRSLFGDLIFAD